jgi:membrane associated rhomboid family serine protease
LFYFVSIRVYLSRAACLPQKLQVCVAEFFAHPRTWLACSERRLFISFMFGVTTSDDYRPVTWMGRYPVDVTTMLVGVHIVCAILTALVFAVGHSGMVNYLMFDSAEIWSGAQVWRLITYAFIHPPTPSGLLWFAVEMYMLFVFGREVERFIGQRAYIALYLVLLLLPAVVLAVWGLWTRTAFATSGALHFAIFVAFATIYPNVELFLRIMAKWATLILIAIGTLSALAAHDWQTLVVLWTSVGAAFLFIELLDAGPELAWISNLKTRFGPKPKFQVVQTTRSHRVVEPDDVYASIDPILDKISKFGIGSLTVNERRQLDRERERLLKKSE